MNNYERFVAVYTEELTREVTANPTVYRYGVADVEGVVRKMAAALTAGMAHTTGVALERTCKVLGVKCKRGPLMVFLSKAGA